MTRQDRARQRLTSRENIFHFEEFKDRLLSDNYRNEEVPEVTIKVGAGTKVISNNRENINKNKRRNMLEKMLFHGLNLVVLK